MATGHQSSRREFLAGSLSAAAAATLTPWSWTATAAEPAAARSANERFRIASIGMRYQGTVITEKALPHADVVAICDVDREIGEKARAQFNPSADLYEDYRDLLQRDDIDIVMIGTPDHWHTKMLIDACRAGKDVYCEKPLTLTIDEGKLLTRVVRETGRVVQVGSWERSDTRFRRACEMARSGRLGQLKKVTVTLGKNKTGGPFDPQTPPRHFNWELWQGQTPDVPYLSERTHYTFRWWYEYSGGQMTDWGAHHVDIAQWGMGMENSGPVEILGTAKFPNVENGYNVALDYHAQYRYANGVELEVIDNGRNGVMFEGDAGRIFVNRGGLYGAPAEELASNPFPREDFKLYPHDDLTQPERAGKLESIITHMSNFFDCVRTREQPISDVDSQHRSVTVCHLANISMRLGRPLKWDPEQEIFPEDAEANAWLQREQRQGYEIA